LGFATLQNGNGDLPDVAAVIQQDGKKRPHMHGDIHQNALIGYTQHFRGQDQMAAGADGQKFRQTLYHRENKNMKKGHGFCSDFS
jgi:hypothetical protein